MSKTKRVISSKSLKKITPAFNLKIIVLCVLGAALLVGGFLYKSMVQKSDINMIIDSGPKYPPIPTATPRPLCAAVATFALSNNCGEGSYQNVLFSCGKSAKSHGQGGRSSCKTFTQWYSEAQAFCSASCPSPTPTATPKITPQPSVMCSQEYGTCINKARTCIKYTDSCQKSINCLVPFTACGETIPTPTPSPKTDTSTPAPTSYPSSTPTVTAVPYPTSSQTY